MRRSRKPVVLEPLGQRHCGDQFPAQVGEDERPAVGERPCRVEILRSPPGQREPVLALRLCACRRNRPDQAVMLLNLNSHTSKTI